MATITQRKNTYYVIYNYNNANGQKKQKWESFKTMTEAKNRKKEVETNARLGIFEVPKCQTMNQLLDEYVELYGKIKWAISTYSSNVALINNYIRPFLGDCNLNDITPRILERYYQTLLKTNAVPKASSGSKAKAKPVTAQTVSGIHKILRSCFNQAVKWEIMEKNPASKAMTPGVVHKKREIWTSETLFHALNVCDDPQLALALNLSFCCSLRVGEMLGLTWDCVDISPQSVSSGKASVNITKELQRVNRKVLDRLDRKDVRLVIPSFFPNTNTVLVLKKPKTDSSIRKVFMPKAVAQMLSSWKEVQDNHKYVLGNDYKDFNLVFASDLGYPIESATIRKSLNRLIRENDLPPVVFHSFRHASVTYKLRLNGGDIKSVQGDTGHSQMKMVTDVYSHILDDSRQQNAELFQKAFYENDPPAEPEASPAPNLPEGITPETLAKLLTNPEVVSLLGALAKTMK